MNSKFMRFFAAALALIIALAFAACGAPEEEPSETRSNIPDKTAPPLSTAGDPKPAATESQDTASTSAPDVTPPADTESTGSSEAAAESSSDAASETVQTVPDDQAPESTAENTGAEKTDDPENTIDKYATRAFKYLDLLNSSRVHVRIIEITSYDGVDSVSCEREYFRNGSERIYINDGNKTLIRGGTATYVDYEKGIYYSYPDDGDHSVDFGYGEPAYRLASWEESDGKLTEVYELAGEGLTSTWEFKADGSLRVTDRSTKHTYFSIYTFELIENSVSDMDFTIPDSFVEVDADEYEFYH